MVPTIQHNAPYFTVIEEQATVHLPLKLPQNVQRAGNPSLPHRLLHSALSLQLHPELLFQTRPGW